ncbi:hypothetical protein B0H11DRAFT_2239121 [Mycena galericulata]|nr:hypothetical protein B0H11DRAFT_2239121 [Mycena galericulata]
MAVYYDECGDCTNDTTAFSSPDFAYDLDPHYNLAPAEYYESCDGDEYSYDYVQPAFDDEPYALQSADYQDVDGVDDGWMQISYAIIYGEDSTEEVDDLDASEEGAECPFHAAMEDSPYDAADNLYDDPQQLEMYAAEVGGISSVREDEAHAWKVLWERGPLIGENELAWAEAMDAWHQHIESDQHIDTVQAPADSIACGPVCATDLVENPAFEYVEERRIMYAKPPTLKELQASYDCGEIPEEDCEECARLLGELWMCELENQRLQAAGYIWDEELGDYVHVTETDSPLECDSNEDDYAAADLPVYPTYDVHHLAEVAPPLPVDVIRSIHSESRVPRQLFPKSSTHATGPCRLKTRHHFFPWARMLPLRRPSFPRPRTSLSKPKHRPRYLRARPQHSKDRDLPPHLTASPMPTPPTQIAPTPNVAAMDPAPSTTPPPAVDESRCSLGTVSLVAADVLVPKDPIPPDILEPTAANLVSPPSRDSAADIVLTPRMPEPPNIPTRTISETSAPSRVSIPHLGVPTPVPKLPKISGSVRIQLKDLSASAQRRMAKKGKD